MWRLNLYPRQVPSRLTMGRNRSVCYCARRRTNIDVSTWDCNVTRCLHVTAQVIVWATIYPQVFTDTASMKMIRRNKDEMFQGYL